MTRVYIAYLALGICTVAIIGIFAAVRIVPISPQGQTAAVQAQMDIATTTADEAHNPSTFPQGIVSINFDDGWKSAFTTGFPIIEAAHLPATFYIVSHYLGDRAYMSVADVLALQAAGEEIGDHTRDHPNLTKLSADEMESEIAGSMADLKADGVQSITTFAYPYGAFNAETNTVIQSAGYAAARTISNGFDSPHSNTYLLDAREVTAQTSVAEVEAWIDEAVERKEWLILVFHQLNPAAVANDPYSLPTASFQAIIDYLTAHQVRVMTNAAVINAYYTH
jgi:peptidoglycan/xylan/chitin deacetylase (PgdA/CDA1 family)